MSYESGLSAELSIPNVISFAYARHALIGILKALDLAAGDEVILSPVTCKVVPLALQSMGLSLVFADINPGTLNLDPDAVESAITERTRAILFQHTYGNTLGAAEVRNVAERHSIPLVEDCAQCLPTRDPDYHPGQFGSASIFSNNLRKPLPAGAGGIAATHDASLASRIVDYRSGFPVRPYLGRVMLSCEALAHALLLNPRSYWLLYRMKQRFTPFYKSPDIKTELKEQIVDSAVLPSQSELVRGKRHLQEIGAWKQARMQHSAYYLQHLDYRFIPPDIARSPMPPFYLFPVVTDAKEILLDKAQKAGIEIVAWPYSVPIYPLEHAREQIIYGYTPGACPKAEILAKRLVGLPTDPKVTARQRELLVELVMRYATHE